MTAAIAGGAWGGLTATALLTRRNLLRYLRVPALLATATVLPVMWVLLFTYVFGGAIVVPEGRSYVDFLLPGILVLAAAWGCSSTALSLGQDLDRGVVDRFRTLPMTRTAFLAARTLADAVRNLAALLVVLGVGLAIGFRFRGSLLEAVGALLVPLALGFALSWVGAAVAMYARDPEAAEMAGLLLVIPLVFLGSIFVPVATMPPGLRAVARANPVTSAVDATRALAGGAPVGDALLHTGLWVLILLVVFVPLTVLRYSRTAR